MRDPGDGVGMADGVVGASGSLRVQRLDVTDPSTMQLPDALRVLVNNAGVEAEHPPFEATPLDLWRRMYETNVFGLIDVTRRAIPALRAAGAGVICNVTSSSILAPVPFYAPYRSSKAAVSAIGESLRAELAPFGIRVVEIMPGPIDTDMLARIGPSARGHRASRVSGRRGALLRGAARGRGAGHVGGGCGAEHRGRDPGRRRAAARRVRPAGDRHARRLARVDRRGLHAGDAPDVDRRVAKRVFAPQVPCGGAVSGAPAREMCGLQSGEQVQPQRPPQGPEPCHW